MRVVGKPVIKNFIGPLLVLALGVTTSLSQDIKVLDKNSFVYDGTIHDRKAQRYVLESDEVALEQYDRYLERYQDVHRERTLGTILVVVGGATAVETSRSTSVGQVNNTILYVGLAGVSVGTTLFIASFRKKQHLLQNAIDIYNDNLPALGMAPYLKFGLTANGLGVVYQF